MAFSSWIQQIDYRKKAKKISCMLCIHFIQSRGTGHDETAAASEIHMRGKAKRTDDNESGLRLAYRVTEQ